MKLIGKKDTWKIMMGKDMTSNVGIEQKLCACYKMDDPDSNNSC